jgi:RNA polymerase sigma factor (sigma-70 family)
MQSPLAEGCDSDSFEKELVCAALNGNGDALDALIRRHQGFIYGIVVRMLWDPRDAEDATQEILIKIVTGLSSFRGASSFRTWAYRIATNHVLNWRRGRAERAIKSFDDLDVAVDDLPDLDLGGELGGEAERRLLVEETQVACLTGMLLCLGREQRLVFVLGEVFEVSDALGSELLGITRASFRQRLKRARQQLYEYMRGNCGLANPVNPCRCERKIKAAIRAGVVDPKTLRFVPAHVAKIERAAKESSHRLEHLVGRGYAHLYRGRGVRDPPDMLARLHAILADQRFRATLGLDRQPS